MNGKRNNGKKRFFRIVKFVSRFVSGGFAKSRTRTYLAVSRYFHGKQVNESIITQWSMMTSRQQNRII
jgi:hypothetical protein